CESIDPAPVLMFAQLDKERSRERPEDKKHDDGREGRGDNKLSDRYVIRNQRYVAGHVRGKIAKSEITGAVHRSRYERQYCRKDQINSRRAVFTLLDKHEAHMEN
ncbi:MAG: hypothetical protein AAAB35_26795, partial [Phyllobacterium sp.]|uniref:hypothetical protein n=1 Tax=Phyllobacterium sp. TaxID=1871046 RepID=UPI0030F312D6